MINKIAGYKYIVIQPGVCGSRPTIEGHRIEPRHFSGMTLEEIKKSWNYLKIEQIKEALLFLENSN